jgi:DNA-binding MarR family transcriptional regulator
MNDQAIAGSTRRGTPAETHYIERSPQDEEFERRAQRVFDGLRELRKMSHHRLYEELYGEGDEALEPAQYDALELLLSDTEWRMTDFASALRVDRSTATRMVDRLERAGVATRGPSEIDGRGIIVRATRAGRLRRTRVVEGRREFMREFLRVFRDDEIDTLNELMERLADSVAAVNDERAAAAAAAKPVPEKEPSKSAAKSSPGSNNGASPTTIESLTITKRNARRTSG